MYIQELDRKTDISERKKKLLADLSDYNISVSVIKYRAEFASVKYSRKLFVRVFMIGMRKTLVDYYSIIRRFDKTDNQPENIC